MQLISKYLRGPLSVAMIAAMCTMMAGCSKGTEKSTSLSSDTEVTAEATAETTEIETVPLDTVMLTVDDVDYTLQDLMYVIYYLEEDYAYNASYYELLYGIDFWNDIMDEDTNQTGSDIAREEAISMAEIIAVLAPIAATEGYTYSDEDEESIEYMIDTTLENMDDEYSTRTGFTEENLTKMVKKLVLAFNYYNAQVDSQEVDEESIKESVSYDEYAQTRLEYIFIETSYYDEDGETVSYSAEEITQFIKEGKEMLALVKDGTSMSDAISEVVGEESTNVYTEEYPMYDSDMGDALTEAVESLKEGELYDGLVETDDGYYIVRLVENNATDDYDEAVQDAIDTQKQALYQIEYDELIAEHEVTVNEDAWNQIVFGHYAYPELDESEDEESSDDYFDLSELTEEDTATSEEEDGSVG